MDLNPDQLKQLQALGIDTSKTISKPTQKHHTNTNDITNTPNFNLSLDKSVKPLTLNSQHRRLLPLLSISGFTLFSLGGILLLKYRQIPSASLNPVPPSIPDQPQATPTQVPKSIQHFLLTSQQYFTQALELQAATSSPDPNQMVNLINQSIIIASDAIKAYPSDYRAYEQRARIYQSLIDSQPQYLPAAIADFSQAFRLNSSSSSISRSLASLYARQGDTASTLTYLTQTINLEPTNAQNFYDLARLQQQVGLLPQALLTYDRLSTLISDPTQKQQIASEKSSLEKLLSQNPQAPISPTPIPKPSLTLPESPSLLQANSNNSGLIIAAPQATSDISVSSLTASNSLSGTATLPANTKEIILQNSLLTSSSNVYLTIVSGNPNLSLQILSRSGTSFTVGLDQPTTSDLIFKWWIVNP